MMRTTKGLAKGSFLNIKHNYGSKIYHKNHKNQVTLDCDYAKHKCLSNILIGVIDSHKLKWSVKKQKQKKKHFFLLNWEEKRCSWEKRWLFSIGNWAKIQACRYGR